MPDSYPTLAVSDVVELPADCWIAQATGHSFGKVVQLGKEFAPAVNSRLPDGTFATPAHTRSVQLLLGELADLKRKTEAANAPRATYPAWQLRKV